MTELKELSFKERRQRAEFDKLLKRSDPDSLFDIPMDEIDQFLDSANDSKDDPIVLHGKAIVAVKRLLTHFGIDSLPQTVGEFRGALWYCKILQSNANSIRTNPVDDALWDKITSETIEKMMPELHAPYLAYKNYNLEELRRIHREEMTFSVMSSYHHPDHGWLSRGKVKKDTAR